MLAAKVRRSLMNRNQGIVIGGNSFINKTIAALCLNYGLFIYCTAIIITIKNIVKGQKFKMV